MSNLTAAEKKVIFLMRELKNRYEKIEIKLDDTNSISVVTSSTTKETFKKETYD